MTGSHPPSPSEPAPLPDFRPQAPPPAAPPIEWGSAGPPGVPPASAGRGGIASLWPAFLVLGGIVVFLGIVLYLVRDNQSIDDLAVGSCFDVPAATEDLSTVARRDCTSPHDAEVFHVVDHPGSGGYPVEEAWDEFVEATCVPAFESYVGIHVDASEELTMGYFFPEAEGWDSGDREVICYVNRLDEAKVSQSLKGSG